ncbi:hypothetical protein VTO42DRAFT_7785 [Malbranchea cinnamomea]
MQSSRPSMLEGTQAKTRTTPGPYGSSCANCSRAKCKCMQRTNCERCHLWNKVCVPSASVRKRGPKRVPGSWTAQLEQKLDGVLSMLKTHPNSLSVTAGWSTLPHSGDTAFDITAPNPVTTTEVSKRNPISPEESASRSLSGDDPLSIDPTVAQIAPDEAEECLKDF